MTRLVQFKSNDGFVTIEVDDRGVADGGAVPVGRGNILETATASFQDALTQVQKIATEVITTVSAIPTLPNDVCVEFGVKLSAGAGAVIAHASTEANFVVKLTWKR